MNDAPLAAGLALELTRKHVNSARPGAPVVPEVPEREARVRRRRQKLEVMAELAGLVDVHGAGVEPPPAVDAVEGVAVAAGDDHLQRAARRWPG